MGIFKRKPKEILIRQLPRVNVGLGRKISDGNYGSLDSHISLSIDVEPDETVEEAWDRCFKKVRKRLNEDLHKLGMKGNV